MKVKSLRIKRKSENLQREKTDYIKSNDNQTYIALLKPAK